MTRVCSSRCSFPETARALGGIVAAIALLMLLAACEPEDAPPPPGAGAPEGDEGDTWAVSQVQGEGFVRVLYVHADGWAYTDMHGDTTGVSVEIMRDFASWVHQEHGVNLDVVLVEVTDWTEFYERIRDGGDGLFGLGNVTITDERREEVAFSPPYLENVAVLITHEDIDELESVDELSEAFADLQPLAFRGTLHQDRLESIMEDHDLDVELAESGSNTEIINRVSEGGYFAYVDAYNYWQARQQGAPIRHHQVMDEAGEEFGIIMPLDSDWQAPLEEFFEYGDGYLNSPRYHELIEQHLGTEVADQLTPH